MASNLLAMAFSLIAVVSNLLAMAFSLIAVVSNLLDGLQPNSDGLQPNSDGRKIIWTSHQAKGFVPEKPSSSRHERHR